MKNFIVIGLLGVISISSLAQNPKRCMSHVKTVEKEKQQLRFKSSRRVVKQKALDYSKARKNHKKIDKVYTIPVVVHVLYKTSSENISDAQINSQIDVLNKDFRKLNEDVSNAPAEFAPLAADVKIQFQLATVDPTGKPTNGINRKSTTKSSWQLDDGMKEPSKGGIAAWDTKKYLNVWVCNLSGGTLGYAYLPGSGIEDIDGLVINPDNFGSKDYDTDGSFYLQSGLDLGRTATHEIGHYLNLEHIWADGDCSTTDYVDDTPSADDSHYGCPRYPTASCGSNDMTMNYMDYVDDGCMYMFTHGQKARMRALFETGGFRASLPIVESEPSEPTDAYCTISSKSTNDEYIQNVSLGGVANTTGADGYGNYTSLVTDVEQGANYDLVITPKWTGSVYDEGYAVWIDFDNNKTFEASEKVFSKSPSQTTSIVGTINIPADAKLGEVRMRVAMEYNKVPTSCGEIEYGEAEDYALLIAAPEVVEPEPVDTPDVVIEPVDTPDVIEPIFSSVIISGYVEGSSYNKALEITNLGEEAVSLSDYTIKTNINGGSSWNRELTLSGILAPGQHYIIVYYRANDSVLLSRQDLLTNSTAINFNGNDPVGLFKGTDLVDIVGDFASGDTYFAKDEVLIRKSSVLQANSIYIESEWIQQVKDDYSEIGTEVMAGNELATDLFISEYVEGSSYNKAIEIANFTGATVDLSNYSLSKNPDGTVNWQSAMLDLSGNLEHGETFTIVYSRASATELVNAANLTTSSSVMSFNGNDPIGLFKNNELIDVVGNYNSGIANFGKDITLVRNGNVAAPSTTYNIDEWEVFDQNTFSNIGNHSFGGQTGKIFDNESTDIYDLTVFPNPAEQTTSIRLTLVKPVETTLTIYNSLGAMIYSRKLDSELTDNTININVSDFAPGVYFVNTTSQNQIVTKRLVVL